MKQKFIEPYTSHFDTIKEMSNIEHQDIGIDHGTVYISTHEGHHGPRIKYYRGRPGDNIPSASISISKNPEVKEDSRGLKESEKKELFAFVIKNKKVLLYLWVYGNTLLKREGDNKVNNLKKI